MENSPASNIPKEIFLHPLKYWLTWIIIFFLVVGGASWLTWGQGFKGGYNQGFGDGNEQAKTECSQLIDKICGVKTNAEDSSKNKECGFKKDFSGNEKEWQTQLYRKKKDGFWCPKEGFIDPIIWYEEGLKPNFKRLVFEYEIKKDDELKRNNPPSFVFAYGKEKEILKSWVPEGENLQLWGFAKNLNFDLGKSELTRETPESLSSPVRRSMIDTFSVEPAVIQGNDLFLNFDYQYTSALTKDEAHKILPKQIKMQISNISASLEKYPFGIGTYVGNCIRIISYEICQ